jgi:UDP-glucose:(heptosyl)LPS alpha-1,3-glucosyltransferase
MRLTPASRAMKRLSGRFNLRQRLLLAEERRLLRRYPAPHVIAISEYVKRQLQTLYGFGGEQVSVVFNGVDAIVVDDATLARADRIRAFYELGERGRLLLVVANNFRLKGVESAIRLLAGLKASWAGRAALVVVGRDDSHGYAALARALGVGEQVHFAGAVDDVPAMYAAADVLLHPTWYDPCSRVVLEALTVGLPCITTRFNGAAEAIKRPEQGAVVDTPADVSAMLSALIDFVLVSRHERRAERDVLEAVSMARHAEGVMAVYERVLASKGRT